MRRTRDAECAERPDLPPVHPEPAEDAFLATSEQRSDATQSTGDLERSGIDRRARRAPTAKDVIDEVICHEEDSSRTPSPSLLSYLRDTYMSESIRRGGPDGLHVGRKAHPRRGRDRGRRHLDTR